MQIQRLELAAADPHVAARFYSERLGLPVDGVEVRFRRTTVAFVPGEGDPRYHFALNVPGGRTADALGWLEERVDVLPFESGERVVHFDWIGADSLYFHDAAGNVVELMVREDIEDDRPGAFSPEHLLEVTEIGIASQDVPATVASLCEALGAGIYWGNGESLTAVGDARGAVLVSPAGRGWIPTGLPAVPHPTTIVADGERSGRTEVPGGPYVVETVA